MATRKAHVTIEVPNNEDELNNIDLNSLQSEYSLELQFAVSSDNLDSGMNISKVDNKINGSGIDYKNETKDNCTHESEVRYTSGKPCDGNQVVDIVNSILYNARNGAADILIIESSHENVGEKHKTKEKQTNTKDYRVDDGKIESKLNAVTSKSHEQLHDIMSDAESFVCTVKTSNFGMNNNIKGFCCPCCKMNPSKFHTCSNNPFEGLYGLTSDGKSPRQIPSSCVGTQENGINILPKETEIKDCSVAPKIKCFCGDKKLSMIIKKSYDVLPKQKRMPSAQDKPDLCSNSVDCAVDCNIYVRNEEDISPKSRCHFSVATQYDMSNTDIKDANYVALSKQSVDSGHIPYNGNSSTLFKSFYSYVIDDRRSVGTQRDDQKTTDHHLSQVGSFELSGGVCRSAHSIINDATNKVRIYYNNSTETNSQEYNYGKETIVSMEASNCKKPCCKSFPRKAFDKMMYKSTDGEVDSSCKCQPGSCSKFRIVMLKKKKKHEQPKSIAYHLNPCGGGFVAKMIWRVTTNVKYYYFFAKIKSCNCSRFYDDDHKCSQRTVMGKVLEKVLPCSRETTSAYMTCSNMFMNVNQTADEAKEIHDLYLLLNDFCSSKCNDAMESTERNINEVELNVAKKYLASMLINGVGDDIRAINSSTNQTIESHENVKRCDQSRGYKNNPADIKSSQYQIEDDRKNVSNNPKQINDDKKKTLSDLLNDLFSEVV